MRHKIYALFDFVLNSARGLSLEAFLSLPKVRRATILQYRDKVNDFETRRENLLFLKARFGGIVIANDDPNLAMLADGLHVGQEDLLRYGTSPEKAIAKLRTDLGERMLGLSTHNAQEIAEANALPIDYIGLGAYRATRTKDVTNLLGERLSALAAGSRHPVAAIGGVKSDDIIDNIDYLVLGSDLYED